eukprot:1689623-Alexandrium_andersonii.AAC.1
MARGRAGWAQQLACACGASARRQAPVRQAYASERPGRLAGLPGSPAPDWAGATQAARGSASGVGDV